MYDRQTSYQRFVEVVGPCVDPVMADQVLPVLHRCFDLGVGEKPFLTFVPGNDDVVSGRVQLTCAEAINELDAAGFSSVIFVRPTLGEVESLLAGFHIAALNNWHRLNGDFVLSAVGTSDQAFGLILWKGDANAEDRVAVVLN